MLAVDKESDDLVYRHFYSLGHHGLSLIDRVNDKDDLLAKEGQWVYRLRSLSRMDLMRVISFLAIIEGNVTVSKNFYFILSVIHIISVRLQMSLLFEILRLFTVKVVARAFVF